MLVDAVVVLFAVTTPPTDEGVPPWVTYLVTTIGTLIVVPIVAVLVRALARRLGVPDDTQPGTPEENPATRQGPEQNAQAPAERYDAQMAIIEQTFVRQDQRIAELAELAQRQAALLATVSAERDRLAWMYEAATGRPAPGPPPPTPPSWTTPPTPPPGSSSV